MVCSIIFLCIIGVITTCIIGFIVTLIIVSSYSNNKSGYKKLKYFPAIKAEIDKRGFYISDNATLYDAQLLFLKKLNMRVHTFQYTQENGVILYGYYSYWNDIIVDSKGGYESLDYAMESGLINIFD